MSVKYLQKEKEYYDLNAVGDNYPHSGIILVKENQLFEEEKSNRNS